MKVEEEMAWDGEQVESPTIMALFMKGNSSKICVKEEDLSL